MTGKSGLMRWGEIDTDAIEHNAAAVRGWTGSGTRLMAMVKANGYGHGAVRSAAAALRGGATWLGVYTPQEALELREARIDVPLLVAGYSPHEWLGALVDSQVDVTVFDDDSVLALASVATSQRPARCQVKVDTGLGRLGFAPGQVPALAGTLRSVSDRVRLTGVFTHFADTARDSPYTTQQNAALLEAVATLRPMGPELLTHAAGTAAVIGRPDDKWGEVPVAVAAVARDGLTIADLDEFLSDRLARYKHPKALEIVDALPRNPAGKVLKTELRVRFAVATPAIDPCEHATAATVSAAAGEG